MGKEGLCLKGSPVQRLLWSAPKECAQGPGGISTQGVIRQKGEGAQEREKSTPFLTGDLLGLFRH